MQLGRARCNAFNYRPYVSLCYRKWTRTPRNIYLNKQKKIGRRAGNEILRSLCHPPEFTLPLYNRAVTVGDDVTFTVTGW